ncbi:DUF4383 domain-containing protein [Antribacter gilvus]|uniref:DUF4383 domain-containing protein n=1 Tax=Antribacter gilvus TaxID=2304675 RepID=UPI00198114D1|nr:DUF4383 domain-containing protein [Antribacter gilvus]
MVQQTTVVRRRRGVHQWLALIVGLVFLAIGIAGFFVTGFNFSDVDSLTEHDPGQTLLGFSINPLHNIVHVVIGLLGVMLWPSSGGARTFGWILLLGYGATFVYGLLVMNGQLVDYLNLNQADQWLHLGAAILGLLIAILPRPKDKVETTTAGYGDPDYRDPDRDPAYRDPDYRDASRRDPAYRDPDYREPPPRDPAYREAPPREAAPREAAPRDPAYRDPEYREPPPREAAPRDPAYRDPDYPEPGTRSPGPQDPGRPGPGR